MPYFAKCEPTTEASKFTVVEVIAADQEFVDTQPGFWVQTSYNNNFRGRFAGAGDIWDGTNFSLPPVPPTE